jgi:GTP-binding protein
MEIRNIAIIAHVDHGKTTLTDALLRQTGSISGETSMDSNSLEQERGITIYSKNASLMYKDTKINIVDTPGHADFGSEVERVLRSIDSVLLVVDAQEGPMPQTRFVLKKSLELGLKPIVILNKIDKPAADPDWCEEAVLELFLELGANDEQADFTSIYAIGRDGVAMKNLDDPREDLTPLLDLILDKIPPTLSETKMTNPFTFQGFNLAYDNYLGRMAIGRIYDGSVKTGQQIFVKKPDGETRQAKITKMFSFSGLDKKSVDEAVAGDIVMIAGIADIYIGETITDNIDTNPLPAIKVDEPTVSINFLVNNSPFAGQEGEFVTSRQIREYLEKELEVNVGLKVDFITPDMFTVYGRGELHISILLENMRRAGYEVQVSQPQVIIKEIDGHKLEPFEEIIADIPTQYQGTIIEKLSKRAFVMTNMVHHQETLRLTFEGPTRGLLGYRNQFIVDTKGEGILSGQFLDFKPYIGPIAKKEVGSMVSMANGKVLGYSLFNLQDRGSMYIGPGTDVYEGMVIGNVSKGIDMTVNPTKGKQLTNMRASGSDDSILLIPPVTLNIERGLEIMQEDEYLEITPKSVRLRKQYLKELDRVRSQRRG